MRRWGYLILLFLLLGQLSCSSIWLVDKTGKGIEAKKIKKIIPGVTTRDDIITIFGDPMKVFKVVKRKENVQELYYKYIEEKTPTYLKGFFVYKKGVKKKIATLKIIVKDDIVESYHLEITEEK